MPSIVQISSGTYLTPCHTDSGDLINQTDMKLIIWYEGEERVEIHLHSLNVFNAWRIN
jgi:hypothetical protein